MKIGWNRLKLWCSDWWFALTTDFALPAGQTGIIDDLSGEVRDCHEHVARVEAEWLRLSNAVEERDAEIARIRAASIPPVAPFWLGLPNEILSMIVTTNMDGIQATLGGMGCDEESDDPRCNPALPFALKPPKPL